MHPDQQPQACRTCGDARSGAQVWYIVPCERTAAFTAAVVEAYGGDAPRALASLAAKHFAPALSPARLRALGVLRVVQTPGYAVVTLPVRRWMCVHLTQISKGVEKERAHSLKA